MLDFRELATDGVGFEQLVRELLLILGYEPRWSGVGPDGGRDLSFEEPGTDLLGRKPRRWLVSCKHNAASGKAVGAEELGAVVEAAAQHDADGLLLVCSTHPSSAAAARLEQIEASSRNRLVTHTWDAATLQRLLTSPRGWAVAQRFLPMSAGEHEWRVFATEAPNRWVVIRRGQYLRLALRHESTVDFALDDVATVLDYLQGLDLPEDHHLRPRGLWFDENRGDFNWYLDYLFPYGEEGRSLASHLSIDLLEEGASQGGLFFNFDIAEISYAPHADNFDVDHHRYYRRLPF